MGSSQERSGTNAILPQERKGCEHKKLIIKMAAKTLSRIYHVIKTEEPYKIRQTEVARVKN
jgi:hypothetical protein